MTAGAVVSPLLGAAAVNGLCGALVLNNVPCGCDHGRERFYERECSRCAGSGFVAPSVTPGQHLAVATTRTPVVTMPLDLLMRHWAPGSHPQPWTWDDEAKEMMLRCPDKLASIEADIAGHGLTQGVYPGPDGRMWDGHHRTVAAWRQGLTDVPIEEGAFDLGAVVGSVTATTPALPIVDGPTFETEGEWLLVGKNSLTLRWNEGSGPDKEPCGLRLDQCLPWLGDDLVGRWAVLTDNPTTTEQRCPVSGCGEWLCGTPLPTDPCPVCGDEDSCPPVPLPDGVDLTEGTIVEVDL